MPHHNPAYPASPVGRRSSGGEVKERRIFGERDDLSEKIFRAW